MTTPRRIGTTSLLLVVSVLLVGITRAHGEHATTVAVGVAGAAPPPPAPGPTPSPALSAIAVPPTATAPSAGLPTATPPQSTFVHAADIACSACCDGTGSCSYSVPSGPSRGPGGLATKYLQCCGTLADTPKCCPVNRGMTGAVLMCSTDENGYVCKDSRTGIKILTDAAYLSAAGLAMIVVVGGLILCCYCALSATRSQAHYNGQPMFCCTELCCTGNLNF